MYELIGMLGSPYSMKLRALMRYRRIPHIWTVLLPEMSQRRFGVKPVLLPILRFPDGSDHIDSTPLAEALEARHPDGRSAYPRSEAARFLAVLIEDYADEWLTKAMFHYRWSYAEDVDYCSRWLASDILPSGAPEARAAIAARLAERQITRLPIVGCTPENAPIIEATFVELLAILGSHFERSPYLFGRQPSVADFAIYGQLIQLATDPLPARLMRDAAQPVFDWLRRIDDASGLEEDGWDDAVLGSATLARLLDLIGTVYLPFLVANARAVERGEAEFSTLLRGKAYAQGSFKYQQKCLERLRDIYAGLSPPALTALRGILGGSGCDEHLRRRNG